MQTLLASGRCERGVHLRQVARRDVEARQGVAQLRGREVADHAVEMSEHDSRFMGVLWVAYFFIRLGAGNLGNRTPQITIAVRYPIIAGLGLDDLG